jgi:hypothetical protein
MDNEEATVPEMNPGDPGSPAQELFIIRRKFEKKDPGPGIWLRSILSLALYLVLGYYIFRSFPCFY